MEWANDKSKGGVLAHLERLETQMSRSCKNLKDPPRETAESDLGTKIHKLRCLRDKLRAEVKQRQARIKASTANAEPDQTLEISEQEAVGGKEENMKAILQAYRFTGLSGKRTSRGVCVCISTAFEGNLLDSYFVDLVIQKPLRIHHHSVPVFIPLEEISAKYLQTNIQHFLFCLCEYLNAYAGRKYQADQLQRDFAAFLAGPLQRNSLCNLLSFTYKVEPQGRSFPFCARLLYKDLTTTLPTDVTITYQGTDASSTSWEEQRASHENLFFTKPLHQVFTSFAKNGERCGPGNRKLLKDSEPLPRDHPCNENIHPIMMVKGNIALSALMTKVAGVPEEPFKIIRNISMRAGSPSPDHMETSSSPA